jgi:hypothetical protein
MNEETKDRVDRILRKLEWMAKNAKEEDTRNNAREYHGLIVELYQENLRHQIEDASASSDRLKLLLEIGQRDQVIEDYRKELKAMTEEED